MATDSGTPFPDGIDRQHAEPQRRLGRHASPISILLLAALLALAFTGLLGGQPNETYRKASPEAELTVNMPRVIRNGEFFETRITVAPHQAFGDLVVAVTPSLWRDVTVNTHVPGAAEESFGDGAFRFSYGPVEAGRPVEIKLDSQINPALFGGTAGSIWLFDGDRPVAELPIAMRVLP